MNKKRIGIFGGTFSPPHSGHVSAAEQFARALNLDELLIIPDYLPPHKQIDGEVSAQERVEMCEIAFMHIQNASVSRIEIDRGGRSYTSVTLEDLSSPSADLYFLCGTDMFVTLDEWYRPETIFRLATICLIRRENEPNVDNLIKVKKKQYEKRFGARIVLIDAKVTEVSSSNLRFALRVGDAESLRLIPTSVYEYIKRKGLYQ